MCGEVFPMDFFITQAGVRGTGLGFLLLGPHALKSVTWLNPNQSYKQTSQALTPGITSLSILGGP